MRVAVFDLGSTSFQLLVGDVEPDGGLTPVARDRVVLNLGADVAATGRVPPGALDRASQVVRRFRDLADRAAVDEVIPVATAAFREAVNRPELASTIEAAIGTPLRILSGDLEARATVAGIRASVAFDADPWIAIDLGGGSLELALVEGGRVGWTETFPLGAAWITTTLVRTDPMSRGDRRAIKAEVKDLLAPARERSGAPEGTLCIAAGGTAGALARLLAAERWPSPPASLNQFELRLDALDELSRELADLDQSERLALPGIDERRAELLPAGAVVLATALGVFGADGAVHSEWGLREGVILEEIDVPAPASPGDVRAASVARLARRWGPEGEHQGTVRTHALELFDETEELHGLGAHERELLAHAARLHDIGVRISPDKSHRHGAYLVEHGGLRGFSPQEVAMMASMIRFHRGAGRPKPSYGPFAGLDQEERAACQVLTGILRIAHGLGRADESDVVEIGAKVRRGELRILVSGSANPEGAVAGAFWSGRSGGGSASRSSPRGPSSHVRHRPLRRDEEAHRREPSPLVEPNHGRRARVGQQVRSSRAGVPVLPGDLRDDGAGVASFPRGRVGRDVVDVARSREHQERAERDDPAAGVPHREPPLARGAEHGALERQELLDGRRRLDPERVAHRAGGGRPQLVVGGQLLDRDVLFAGPGSPGGPVEDHREVPGDPVPAGRQLREQLAVRLVVERDHVLHPAPGAQERREQVRLDRRDRDLGRDVEAGVVRVPDVGEPSVGDDRTPRRRQDVGDQLVQRDPEAVERFRQRHDAGGYRWRLGYARRHDPGARVPRRAPDGGRAAAR